MLKAPRKPETVRAEGRLAMRQLDARIRAAKQKAKTEPGPLARAVEDLADVVEQLRIAVAARDELERR